MIWARISPFAIPVPCKIGPKPANPDWPIFADLAPPSRRDRAQATVGSAERLVIRQPRPPSCSLATERHQMTDAKLPLIHKAPVEGLMVHVARTGLAIGDEAWLDRLGDGRIGVFARLRQPIFGLIPRLKAGLVGHLGPMAEEIVAPSLAHGDALRVRIIDLVPEHLSNGFPPEVYISVWGDPRHLQPILQAAGLADPSEGAQPGRFSTLKPAYGS
jgi:hypothetical protein